MTLEWQWTRMGQRGYYGYSISAPDATDTSIRQVMELSNKLDRIIDKEIEKRQKIKEQNNKEKRKKQKSITTHSSNDNEKTQEVRDA